MTSTCKHFVSDRETPRDHLGRCQKIIDYLQRGATTAQAEKVAREQLNGGCRSVHFTILFVDSECNAERGCTKFEEAK